METMNEFWGELLIVEQKLTNMHDFLKQNNLLYETKFHPLLLALINVEDVVHFDDDTEESDV